MSQKAFLVSHTAKHVIGLGKVLRDINNRPFEFGLIDVNPPALQGAVMRFLLDHVGGHVELLTDEKLWQLDLEGFQRVDEDYGLPFDGRRSMSCPEEIAAKIEQCERTTKSAERGV